MVTIATTHDSVPTTTPKSQHKVLNTLIRAFSDAQVVQARVSGSCSALQELDVGTNHTQWQTLAGTTGLAGNRQILSFTDAGENAEVRRLSFSGHCQSSQMLKVHSRPPRSKYFAATSAPLPCWWECGSLFGVGARPFQLPHKPHSSDSSLLWASCYRQLAWRQPVPLGHRPACPSWQQYPFAMETLRRNCRWSGASPGIQKLTRNWSLKWPRWSWTAGDGIAQKGLVLRLCTQHTGDRRQLHRPGSHQRLGEMGELPGVARTDMKETLLVAIRCFLLISGWPTSNLAQTRRCAAATKISSISRPVLSWVF